MANIAALGFVNSDGSSYGEGFTCIKMGIGTYQIRLNSVPQRGAPIVNVTGIVNDYGSTPHSLAEAKTWTVQSSQSSVESTVVVRCYDSHSMLSDAPFNFSVLTN